LRFLVALLALHAAAAAAQTYKWVDERGVVNYSNTPPPSLRDVVQPVEERVSTVPSDPQLARDIERYRRTAQAPAEGPSTSVIGSSRFPAQVPQISMASDTYDGPYYRFVRGSPVFFVPRALPNRQPRQPTARLRER
jgi:hypothetical protein